MKRRGLFYFTVGWAILTTVLAFGPRLTMGGDLNGFALNHGPVAHFVAYFVLAGLLFLITLDFESLPPHQCAFNSWAIAGIFATMIEFGQYLVPDRTFDLNDIWFNLIAAGLGSVSLFLVNKKQAGKTVS